MCFNKFVKHCNSEYRLNLLKKKEIIIKIIKTNKNTNSELNRDVNRMVRHDSIRYRFSYPAIRYLPIPQKELTWLSVCVRFRCVCVRFRCACACFRFPRTQSRASYMLALCLRAVLISSPDTWDWTRMHALVVIHRRTLYENVDSAKIKVSFYITDIVNLRVASMHRIVIHCIDI